MKLARRRFLEIVVALNSSYFSTIASASPNLLRSLPNPHARHLTIADAERLCAAYARHQTLDDRCLNLEQFQTASFDALSLLSKYEWWCADFGIIEISPEIAQALSCIPSVRTTFHHLEKVSPMAVATLIAAWEDVAFENVTTLDPGSVLILSGLIKDVVNCADRQISFTGNFKISHSLAVALAQLPLGLSLGSLLSESAFDPRSTQVLSRHLGSLLTINEIGASGKAHSGEESSAPKTPILLRECPFSAQFIRVLSGNPDKRLKIIPPSQHFWPNYELELEDRDFRAV